MDYAACNVVYVDRTATRDALLKKEDAKTEGTNTDLLGHLDGHAPDGLSSTVDANLRVLLDTFSEGMWSAVLPCYKANAPKSMSALLASRV